MKRENLIYLIIISIVCLFFVIGRRIDIHKKRQKETQIKSKKSVSHLSRFTRCTHPALDEISGWSQSIRFPSLYWVHNDSFDRARLFVVNQECTVLKEFAVPQALNIDWEDLTLDRQGWIYVADSGNNFHWRSDLTLYLIQEPNLSSLLTSSSSTLPSSLSLHKKIPFRFPSQTRFPPSELKKRCFDSEALFKIKKDLYLLTKCFYGGQSSIYRLPSPHFHSQSSSPLTLEWIQNIKVGVHLPPFAYRVTGADYHEPTQRLIVLTYHNISLFSVHFDLTSAHPTFTHQGSFPLSPALHRQAEAISWKDAQTILVANEQRDVFQIKVSDIIQSPVP